MPTIKRGEPIPLCQVPGCTNVCKRHTNKVEDGKVKYRAMCRYHKKWGREMATIPFNLYPPKVRPDVVIIDDVAPGKLSFWEFVKTFFPSKL